jgi:hypothetical protein
VPLLRPHIGAMRSEVAIAQRVELERLGEMAFAQVKQQLYEHAPYEWLRKNAAPQTLELGQVESHFLPGRTLHYTSRATISIALQPDGDRLTQDTSVVERRLLNVAIDFIPVGREGAAMQFNYLVFAERLKFEPQAAGRIE